MMRNIASEYRPYLLLSFLVRCTAVHYSTLEPHRVLYFIEYTPDPSPTRAQYHIRGSFCAFCYTPYHVPAMPGRELAVPVTGLRCPTSRLHERRAGSGSEQSQCRCLGASRALPWRSIRGRSKVDPDAVPLIIGRLAGWAALVARKVQLLELRQGSRAEPCGWEWALAGVAQQVISEVEHFQLPTVLHLFWHVPDQLVVIEVDVLELCAQLK